MRLLALLAAFFLGTSAYAAGEGPQERALDSSLAQEGLNPAVVADQPTPMAAPTAASTMDTAQTTMKKTHQKVAAKTGAKAAEGPQELALDRGDEPTSAKPDPQAGITARLNGGY